MGKGWAKLFPESSRVVGTRLESFAPVLHFINPGPFSIKEVKLEVSYLKKKLIICSMLLRP